MSLIVWLPLNGDSHNQGTKQYTETTNTLSYAINGKVTEKCADKGKLVYDKNPLQMVGTICFWLYPKSIAEGNVGKSSLIFGNNTFNDSSRKWTLYMFPDNKSLHSWGCQKEGSNAPNGSFTYNNVLKESTWNHVCVAHDLKNEYIYVNGNLIGTVPWDSNSNYNFDKETDIIRDETFETGTNNFKINDFRIYDTCLSKAEVMEIAKGKMLHYSFENPYAEETTNIPHSLINTDYVTLGEDSIGKYITKTSTEWWAGIQINRANILSGRTYTWSMEVMPVKDINYFIDTNAACLNSDHAGSNDSHFSAISRNSDYRRLEAYKWNRIFVTVKIKSECSNPTIFCTFCPTIPNGDTEVKVYYRNSILEEKPYDTPYTSSNREAGLIRDNSGMGNDGTQVYQREEIPITPKTQTTSSSVPQYGGYTNVYDSNLKTYTINNFSGADNQTGMLGTIKYLSRYHYLNSKICYEFDIKLQDITVTDGKTIRILQQGPTVFKDDTHRWLSSPVQGVDITSRLKNGTIGVYHVCIERIIDNADCVTNVDYYEFGLRFDYVKSGTVTVSNLHAYYQNLDTSTLSLSDNSAIGTHSAYFNGKNYIDCGLVTPLEIDELTLSCWAYRDDWSTLSLGGPYDSALISSVNSGGFGFKIERCAQESIEKSINFVLSYKDVGYLEPAKSYGMAIDYTKLSSGWHLITGVATRNRATLYVDGEKVRECIHNFNKPIYNYDTSNKKRTNLLVGAEPDALRTDKLTAVGVYIDDVRLYATALSDKDIKALYNVKAKIDNKSNLYCNQLVETKLENLVDYSLFEPGNYGGVTHSASYKDGIYTMTILSNTSTTVGQQGPYFRGYEKNSLNHRPIVGKYYKLSMYVKVPKTGAWLIGSEVLPFKQKQYEAGKWYYIEQEGNASNGTNAVIFYVYNAILNVGDKIQVRDFKFYRLYDDENYNPGPNIKGQYKTFELNETGLDEYTNYPTINKYDATWLPVFHHNTNGNTVWFTDEAEALHYDTEYKYSILDQLEGFRGSDGKFEFLLEYPQDLPGQYNRWKQTDNPALVQELFNSTSSPANGYEAIHVDWTSSGWGGLLKSIKETTKSRPFTFIDGVTNHGNWYYAIGCYNNSELLPDDNNWKNGMPGVSGSTKMKEVNLYVRVDSKYMGATIVDKYGAEWLEVFYHDNNNCKVFFDNQTEALHTNSQYKFSILDQLEKFRGNDGKFEFLLEYPTDIPGKYNRWKQTDNPVKVLANNTYANGYEAIHVDWSGNNWGGLLRDTSSISTLLKGSIVNTDNWFFAIGAIKAWGSSYKGVPGPYPGASGYSNPNGIVHDIHLYVRIDNLPNRNEIFRQYKRQTKTKEIIEI